MKHLKKFEHIVYKFERTYLISEERSILAHIETLNKKDIEHGIYYYELNGGTMIKIYGESNKIKTLKNLGFNIFNSDEYQFTWDWKPIDDIETFLDSRKYNL